VITHKLTLDPPIRLPELTQKLIRSHGHSTPSLKISCKSVQLFSRNVADKETKKERNRPKTIPRPPTGGGVIRTLKNIQTFTSVIVQTTNPLSNTAHTRSLQRVAYSACTTCDGMYVVVASSLSLYHNCDSTTIRLRYDTTCSF